MLWIALLSAAQLLSVATTSLVSSSKVEMCTQSSKDEMNVNL